MSTDESRLAESLQQLTEVAAEAGLDPAAARDEGLRVAAAIAQNVPGAAVEWAHVARPGLTDLYAINLAFQEVGQSSRPLMTEPPELLMSLVRSGNRLADEYAQALTEVASSAVMLGTAPSFVIDRSTSLSALYLRVAGSLGAFPGLTGVPGFGLGAPDTMRPTVPGPMDPTIDSPVAQGSSPNGAVAQTQSAAPEPEPEKPVEPEKSVEELLAELDAMIGLDRVKKEIHRQVALLTVERMRTEAGLKAPKMSRHLIFVGNPGTGKTTVARLVGAVYKALGLLPKGQLVEVDRSELVAGYVGQTAIKTAEVCARAIGGVLFIDEAYALTGDQYAQEAVNTLVKEMEDHREDLVVIVAGYPDPMVGFIAQNPGLASRFTTTIEFDDYSDDELLAILDSIAEGSDYELTDDARERVSHIVEATPRTSAFGNGRFSRNLFEHAVGRHAWRLKDAREPTRDDLRLLTAHDFTEQPDNQPHEQPDDQPHEQPDEQPHEQTAPSGPDPVPVRADPDGPADPEEALSDDEHDQSDEDTA